LNTSKYPGFQYDERLKDVVKLKNAVKIGKTQIELKTITLIKKIFHLKAT